MRTTTIVAAAAVLTFEWPMLVHAQGQSRVAAGASEGLEEVIVTAQRREESLQRAAVPVTAIAGEALGGITQAQDLTRIVPSLQIAAAAGPYPLMYVRGVGNFNGNGLSDATLSVNLDGVSLARPSSTSGLLYDVDRVEVLKGPQGTLYGRNATGGALNIITRKPSSDFGGYGAVDVGNFGLVKVNGALNVPLGSTTAARFALQSVDRDGYLSDGTSDADDKAARAQVSFAPTDSLSILTSADYYRQRGKGTGATLLRTSTGDFINGDAQIGNTDPRVNAIYSQSFVFTAGNVLGPLLTTGLNAPVPTEVKQENDFWGISATIDWQTDAGTLTVIPAYRHARLDYVSTVGGFLVDQEETDSQSSLEVRFASSSDRKVSYLVGAYYLDENIDAAPIYDQQINASSQNYETTTKSYAGFGRLGFALTDTLRLTGGVRYTHDEKELSGTLTARQRLCPGSFIPAPAGPQFCFGGVGQIIVPNAPIGLDASDTWSETTWRAGFEWDAAPQSLLYATVETGFKAGGFFFTHDDPTYDPENITAYTLGAKNRFLENRLQLNLEAFYWKYRDQQVSHVGQDSTGVTIFATENVGKATMKGAEVELQFLPATNTLLTVDAQYLKAKYDEFVYTLPNFGAPPSTPCAFTPAGFIYVVDCSGRTPPQSPEWTLNLGIQQTFPLTSGGALVADLHTHYQSQTLTGLEFLAIEQQGAYWVSGFELAYLGRDDKWTVAAYIDNIEDVEVASGTFPHPFAGDLFAAAMRPPRTYGARLRVNF